eukprot:5000564-Prymnesium_polylepis.1
MSAPCPPTLEASRRVFRLRLMSPRAYRDSKRNVVLVTGKFGNYGGRFAARRVTRFPDWMIGNQVR